MTRNAKRFVIIGVALYLFVLWSAFRWGSSLRYPEGSIFAHRAAELRKRLAAEAANQPPPEPPKSTAVTRFEGAGPAYVAARYDDTHVVFLIAPDAEPRFSKAGHGISLGTLIKLIPPAKPSAELMGLQELWEPDSQSRVRLPPSVQSVPIGEPWMLDVSPGFNLTVYVKSPVIAAHGCSLGAGLVAAPANSAKAFSASKAEYFVIRHTPVELADPPVSRPIAELTDWKATADFQELIAHVLVARMKSEVSKMDAQLVANADNPSQLERPWPATSSVMRTKHWLAIDKKLQREEAQLDFDLSPFRLTPDGAPRILARARWKLEGTPVFLMTAWFRADAQPVLLSTDSTWSMKMREGDAGDSLGQQLDFQTVLNEFDADHDGWAELLVHSHDGNSAHIALYLYTDLGLVPTKASFDRDLTAPESCLQDQ